MAQARIQKAKRNMDLAEISLRGQIKKVEMKLPVEVVRELNVRCPDPLHVGAVGVEGGPRIQPPEN